MPAFAAPACELTVVAWRMADLTASEVWWRYVGLGGSRASDALADYLAGTVEWPAGDHNVVAQALNERLWDLGCPGLAPHRRSDTCVRGARSEPGW